MPNYQIVYGSFIVKSMPGFLTLGTLVNSEPIFDFELPIFQDILPHELAKHLNTLLSVSSDVCDSVQCGQLKLGIKAEQITMSMNKSEFIFPTKKHVTRFIKSIPILTLRAAIKTDLFLPLVWFCNKLYETDKWETILQNQTQKQFAVVSKVLRNYFSDKFNEMEKNEILVFTELHIDFIVSILKLQSVIKKQKEAVPVEKETGLTETT